MAITKNRKTSTLLSFFLIITMCIGLIVISPVSASAEGAEIFLNEIEINASVNDGTKWGEMPNYDMTLYTRLSSGGDEDEFEVSTPEELAAIAAAVNNGNTLVGKTIKLTADIDLRGDGLTITKTPLNPNPDDKYNLEISGEVENAWTPIGKSGSPGFAGTFDGRGFEIKNMVVLASSGGVHAGLFGTTAAGATIQNVGIGEGSHVVASSSVASSYSGGIAGINDGMITNCYNTGDVFSSSSSSPVASSYSGGIAGTNDGTITNCYNTGDVFSSSSSSYCFPYSGGIAGSNSDEIANCYNTGTVSSSSTTTIADIAFVNAFLGGIVGHNEGAITNCYNTGAVASSSSASSSYRAADVYAYAGGIVGDNYGDIINCYNTGVVSSSSSNYATFDSSSYSNAGGIAGLTNGGSIANCYNTGAVSSSSSSFSYTGGVAGQDYSGNITNCYNTGDVSSVAGTNTYNGGIGGRTFGSITNCYNTGDVSSSSPSSYAGGIAGDNNGNIADDCFYDADIVITGINSNRGTPVTGLADSMLNSNYKTAQVPIDDIRQIFQNISGYLVADTWYFALPERDGTGIHPKLLSSQFHQIEVTANPAEGGTASSNRLREMKSKEVTLSAEANTGYCFVGWEVVSPEGLQITGDSFTMPSSDVQITAKFEAIPSEPVVYDVVLAFPTYTGGNKISAKIDADSLTFEKLLLEGDEVDKSNYKIDNGSTIITLSNSYLSQFKDGTYLFKAVFTGGYADLTLIVALDQTEPPAPVIYPIIKNIPPFGGSGDVSITIGADSSSFERLILNNKDVDKSNYTVTSGEGGTTIITLKESFLKIFPAGNFTFRAVFANGYTDFTLKVDLGAADDDKKPVDTDESTKNVEAKAVSKNVATGDNTPIGMFVGLIVLAGAVLVLRKRIVRS